jgi:hypothetical protein
VFTETDREAAWIFLPLVGSFLAQLPAIRFDLLRGLKRPIDGGATFRGRRLFGDNKTWRGALMMFSGTFVAALLLSRLDGYWSKIPDGIRDAGPVLFGLLLGAGTVLAELPSSFVKRQIGIAPGAQSRSVAGVLISIWDQGDFVPGVFVALLPIHVMTAAQALWSFAVVAGLHLAISVVGYALGSRKTIL